MSVRPQRNDPLLAFRNYCRFDKYRMLHIMTLRVLEQTTPLRAKLKNDSIRGTITVRSDIQDYGSCAHIRH